MEKTRSYDKQTLQMYWQECQRHRRQMLQSLLFPVSSIILTVAVPYIIGKIIANLTQPDSDPYQYMPYLIGVGITGVIANRIGGPALLDFQARVMGGLQARAYDALMRRSIGFHNNRVGGKLVSDAIDYPNAFYQLSDAALTNLLPFIAILVFGTAAVTAESWQLGVVTTLMSVYAIGSGIYDMRRRAPVRMERLHRVKSVTGHLADSIVNVHTVKTFAEEQRELDRHQDLNQELTRTRISDWTWASRQGNRRIIILLCFQLFMVWLLVRQVQADPSLLGVGIFAFSFSVLLANRLFMINIHLRAIEDGFLNASPMTEILLQQPEVQDAPEAKPLKVRQGAIDLEKVRFRYVDSSRENRVFEQLDLHIRPGEKIGLVGPSGGGKSTLTRLLLRFEDIDGGSIMIDGQEIAGVTQDSLRRAVSYVPQEPLLFHRTIAENITYGRPGASATEIEQAARKAHAHDFIMELSEGYDTIVGERGVKLSGGQRQRIAIARAILKDAPILILDEATSALDSESEVYIQDALWKLMQKRTALVIAHRLSTVQKMDRIIVLEDGRITEEGSHAELLEQKGTYAKLWKHQSGGFIED